MVSVPKCAYSMCSGDFSLIMTTETNEIEPPYAGIKEVVGMAAPIALGTMSFAAMLLADTFFVGKLGTAQLSAVGSAGVWSYTSMTFFIGIASCVSTFVSQSVGRGRREDGAHYTWQAMYVSLLSIGLAAILWPAAPALFGYMGHAANVTEFEVLYFRDRLFGLPFLVGQIALASFFQAIGRPGIPTAISIFAVTLNIFLDYAMIFGHFGFPAMGISGAAWATNISMIVQAGILLAIFLHRDMATDYRTRRAAFDSRKFAELLRIGMPAGVFSILEVMTWAIFISFIVGRFGEIALAANTVAINLMHVSFMPAVAVNHAIAPIVGQWIGKGNPERAKARAYTATRLTSVYMLGMGGTFAFFGPQIISGFNDAPEVIALGHKLLILAAIFQGFDSVNIVISGALRGAGDTRFMTIATAVTAYGVFLPTATILAFVFEMGAVGAWVGATVYIITLAGIMGWRWHAERWRLITIFKNEEGEEDDVASPDAVTSAK